MAADGVRTRCAACQQADSYRVLGNSALSWLPFVVSPISGCYFPRHPRPILHGRTVMARFFVCVWSAIIIAINLPVVASDDAPTRLPPKGAILEAGAAVPEFV